MRRTPFLALALLALYCAVCLGRQEDVEDVGMELTDEDLSSMAFEDAASQMDMKRDVPMDRDGDEGVRLTKRGLWGRLIKDWLRIKIHPPVLRQ